MIEKFKKITNNYLLAPKLIYLIVNLQFYGFYHFRFLFAKNKFDISTEDYGKYTGYTQFITFFTSILIGNITDRMGSYQMTLLSLILLSIVAFMSFYSEFIKSLGWFSFWGCLLFYLIMNNPKQPLLDKIMIEYLDNHTESGSKVYGKQRLFGTFALPLATYASEWCINIGDGEYNFDYLLIYNILATFVALISVYLFFRSNSSKKIEKEGKSFNSNAQEQAPVPSFKKGHAFELLWNFELMFFFLVIFLNAISRSALTIYLQFFHKEILKITPSEIPPGSSFFFKFFFGSFYDKPISTLASAGVVFEIIILFSADKIIDKCGYFLPLIIAQFISLIRFFTYFVISHDNPSVYLICCATELLRGIYFGLIHISSVYIATKMAAPNLRATSQMIYQGTFGALGFLLSGLLFGGMFKSDLTTELPFLEKEIIYRKIFLINIFLVIFNIVICIIKYGIIDRVLFDKRRERKKLSKYDVVNENNKLMT